MQHLKIFIDLTRLNKTIGFMLLFWPCSWGLAYAYFNNTNLNLFLYYLLLFFLGSVLMRSAGCIFNDIVDKDFDKKVKRTKTRPIAAGKITVYHSLVYVLILCLIAFLILLQFNLFTIFLGIFLVGTFVTGLAWSISTGLAGFWKGLPFWIIVLFCLSLLIYDSLKAVKNNKD